MNTFCGCDTAAMDDLSSIFGERAGHLGSTMDGASRAVAAAAWIGPDGDSFRELMEGVVEEVIDLVERLRELGELLRTESEEQRTCSEPDGSERSGVESPGARGSELPWDLPGRTAPARGFGTARPQPMLGGPLMARDPVALADRLPPLPGIEELGPLIGGPMIRDPLGPIPAPRPVPEGEEFALDPEILADARKDRRVALGGIPLVGTAQMLMGAHDGISRALDNAEEMLETSGLGILTPAVSIGRIPHIVSGVALGEKSVPGQTMDVVDRQLANVVQTGREVSSAIGEGDLGGVVGAVERGGFRHVDATADLLTATPAPAVAEATSDLAGTAADVVEPLSPTAAEPLRAAEEAVGDAGEAMEGTHDWLTDGERYYDLRRQWAPMPWDPQG